MAGVTVWKGYIHFADTEVPVKLHTAVREERIQFHLLHKHDRVRLRQQMICAYEKKPVPTEAQAKGFEVEEGKYILVDPEELEETSPEESRMIEVHEFVRNGQIDPLFRDRTYYLEPGGQAKEYNAFATALKEMEAEGICTWTMRKRSFLGSLQVHGKILRLNTLRYADEVISVKSLELQEVPLSEKELKIGGDLIIQWSGSFRPEQFENEHEKKLRHMIERKARGEKIVVLRPRHLKPTKPDKLLEALEESLKKVA